MSEDGRANASLLTKVRRKARAWIARKRRRRLRRRVASWAAGSAAFVTRHGLADVCFRSDGQIIIEAAYGVRLRYVPGIERSAMDVERGGVWEPRETELMLGHLADDAVFFDVGANCGWFSLVAARRWPGIRVHAFEPVGQTFELLVRNIELNGLHNVTANNVGLWDENKPLRFTSHRGPKNYAVGEIADDRSVVAACIRLDDYVQQKGIDRVDFIKCDVEGAELHFLRGAQQCLRTFGPTLLLETQARRAARFGYSPVDVIGFLISMGYEYSIVTEDRGLVPQSDHVGRDISLGRNFLLRRPV